jgi:predicted transcriptional regulator
VENGTRERILEFLSERPRGSTISEISDEIDMSRVTASKYLEILVAEEKVDRREVGRAKLHYLNENEAENSKEAKIG